MERNISGRRIELSAQFLTVQHPASQLKGPTKQLLRSGEVCLGQRIPNTRAAGARSSHLQRRRGGDSIAKLIRQRADIIQITFASITEAKIVAEGQIFDSQALDEYLFNEFPGTQLAQPLVKGQAQYVINATRLEQGPLVTQRRNARRCFQWPQVLAGQWFEGHHCRLHTPRVRLGLQMCENRLMAQVYTVECANRHRASAVMGSQIMPTADEFHPRLFPSNTRCSVYLPVTGRSATPRCHDAR